MSDASSLKGQSAKPFQFRHGSFDISVFSDGFITLPGAIHMPEQDEKTREPILAKMGGDTDSAPYHSNTPVIRTKKDLILVDTGSGTFFQPTAGALAANLRSQGIDPAEVTRVIYTHTHPDHSGGTVDPDGKLIFPNATYYVNAAEWDFWCDKDYETHMPAILHPFAVGAQRDLGAVEDRLVRFRPGDEILEGIVALDTAGHTPGHISLELGGDDHLIITGDAASNWVVSFEHPDWRFGFDYDNDLAVRNRKALIDRAAHEKIKLLGYHWAIPGYGYAERNGQAYRFAKA